MLRDTAIVHPETDVLTRHGTVAAIVVRLGLFDPVDDRSQNCLLYTSDAADDRT